jgi:hypothetical protein
MSFGRPSKCNPRAAGFPAGRVLDFDVVRDLALFRIPVVGIEGDKATLEPFHGKVLLSRVVG